MDGSKKKVTPIKGQKGSTSSKAGKYEKTPEKILGKSPLSKFSKTIRKDKVKVGNVAEVQKNARVNVDKESMDRENLRAIELNEKERKGFEAFKWMFRKEKKRSCSTRISLNSQIFT